MFPTHSIKHILTADVKCFITSILSFGEAQRGTDPCALLWVGSLMHFREPLQPLCSLVRLRFTVTDQKQANKKKNPKQESA